MVRRRKKASVKDVAALAGVSLGTVSNVVNSPEIVSADLRARVQDAIDKLGWIPNESARSLRVGHSRSIALVIMDISNPFFTDLVVGAEDALEDNGYTVQVGNSRNDERQERKHLGAFARQSLSGVLLSPIRGPSDAVTDLRLRGVPVVLLDRTGSQSEFCSVSVNDVEGGRMALAHLLEQGHRSIAVVGGPGELQQVSDRRQGAELAVSVYESASLLVMSTDQLDVSSGVRAAETIAVLPDGERPTAVFAVNDLLAIGLLQGFVTAGLRVPDDVAIVGYDDIEFAAAAAVPLSSVRQPRKALGRRAVELLFEEIRAGSLDETHEHVQLKFKPELVVRRSSAKRPFAAVR
ncbi:LacI family transcriptional regulator [Kribbella pittospori]|uniref:LacI family transcriptional regulator n=1 Tax=Kribbella pittospori TaxID=722689 RepID=A0A4R0K5Q9_9ACTN|nr:LacI family DNA-binding transcriptional regulator [Kribbella pittospori]TCC50335.1 LacI family transcriptional regulator [Kribbella pittospori]